MGIRKKKILSSDEFQNFRKNETEKAKEAISETVCELEKNGCEVKVICTDIDNEALVVGRTPLSYDGLIPSIIETISNKKKNQNPIRTEKNGKICVIELHIKANLKDGKRAERIIRYFVFKYAQRKGKFIVKHCKNKIYSTCVSGLLKKLGAKGKDYAFRENPALLLFRCIFPSRFGKQAYMYHGKDYTAASYICFFALFLLILVLICLLPLWI